MTAVTLLAGGILLALRLLAGPVLPVWVAAIVVVSLLIAMQALIAPEVVALVILKGRIAYELLPRRDCQAFVQVVHVVWLRSRMRGTIPRTEPFIVFSIPGGGSNVTSVHQPS